MGSAYHFARRRSVTGVDAHGVEYGEYGHAHVAEHRHPHVGYAERGQHEYGELDDDGEHDVLHDDGHRLFGYALGEGQTAQVVLHQHDVGRLYRGVAAHAAHGDAYIRAHEHGRVVDAVAHEAQHVARGFFGEQLFHFLHLVLREQRGLVARNARLFRHARGDGGVVARQHDGAAAHAVQTVHDLAGLGLDLVRDEQTTDELAVVRDVDHRAHAVRRDGLHALAAHELVVAAGDALARLLSDDALARHVGERPARLGGLTVLLHDGARYGVSRAVLRDGGEAEHLVRAVGGIHLGDGEVALGERARLIEHEYVRSVELFQVVGAFDEYAVTRRRAYAREEGQRDGYDERARAGHDQEAERAVYPRGPVRRDQPGQYGEYHRHAHDGGSVVLGELGYEVLRLGLLLARALHQLEYLGHGGVVELFGDAHFQTARDVHAAADDRVALRDVARERFARQRLGVQRGRAAHGHAVQRDLLAGVDDYDVPHFHLVGIHAHDLVAAQEVGVVGTDVHQRGYRLTGLARSVALEELAHLIEQQHGARLVEALDLLARRAAVYRQRERAQRRHAHQEVLVQHLPVHDVARRPPQHIVAYDEVYDEVEAEREHPRGGAVEHIPQPDRLIRHEQRDEQRERHYYADEVLPLLSAHLISHTSSLVSVLCGSRAPPCGRP